MELDELRDVVPVRSAPRRAGCATLSEVGEEVTFTDGEELFHEGKPADYWWILLEGNVELVRRAGRESPVVIMTMEQPGPVGGRLPGLERRRQLHGDRARRRQRPHVPRAGRATSAGSARQWFPFSVHLIEGFFQTVRSMDMLTRHREAMVALGTLAAGLAHELNNPAAASARAVDALRETLRHARWRR